MFDEVENVAPLIAEIEAALAPRGTFEIIFVDDGSTDGTGARLAALLDRHPALRVLRHPARFGQSAALRAGIHAARADWVATLDGDGQNDPADIARLLEAAGEGGVALVAGIRRRRRDTLWKRFGSRLANGLRQAVLRDGCPDTGCGLKLMRRDIFLELPYFNGLHRFVPALVQAHGHAVRCVAVAHRPRRTGRTKYGNLGRAVVGLYDLLGVLWLARRTRLPSPGSVEEIGAAPRGRRVEP